MEQMYQYFGCMTPILNIKYSLKNYNRFINQSACKILYSDVGCSLSVLGHFQGAKINGRYFIFLSLDLCNFHSQLSA